MHFHTFSTSFCFDYIILSHRFLTPVSSHLTFPINLSTCLYYFRRYWTNPLWNHSVDGDWSTHRNMFFETRHYYDLAVGCCCFRGGEIINVSLFSRVLKLKAVEGSIVDKIKRKMERIRLRHFRLGQEAETEPTDHYAGQFKCHMWDLPVSRMQNKHLSTFY